MSLVRNPIIFALDVDSKSEALQHFNKVSDVIGAVKLGPRLIYKYGADLIKEMSEKAPVFVDNKYFDIPSTMVSAVKASFDAGATLVTVHAMAGSEALSELAQLEAELNKIRPFRILAVTILTSWTESSMPHNLQSWPVDQHVRSLAELTYQSGLRGLVCSGHELKNLKDLNFFKVTPGIRLATDVLGDQKRAMTPKQALQEGASALVIGRPILQSSDPQAFVQNILNGV